MNEETVQSVSKTPICLFVLEFLMVKGSITVEDAVSECRKKIEEFLTKMAELSYLWILREGDTFKPGENIDRLHSILTKIFYTVPHPDETAVPAEHEEEPNTEEQPHTLQQLSYERFVDELNEPFFAIKVKEIHARKRLCESCLTKLLTNYYNPTYDSYELLQSNVR